MFAAKHLRILPKHCDFPGSNWFLKTLKALLCQRRLHLQIRGWNQQHRSAWNGINRCQAYSRFWESVTLFHQAADPPGFGRFARGKKRASYNLDVFTHHVTSETRILGAAACVCWYKVLYTVQFPSVVLASEHIPLLDQKLPSCQMTGEWMSAFSNLLAFLTLEDRCVSRTSCCVSFVGDI